jgi:hypothetical protein
LRRVLAAVLGVSLLGGSAASASAVSRPRAIASYCSPSGDLCYGIVDRSGAVYFELSTAARYFGRYRLCVRLVESPLHGGKPDDSPAWAERCGSFPVFRQRGSVWGSSVKFARQYPNLGRGTYRVTWKLGADPLGPSLRFRLPLGSR